MASTKGQRASSDLQGGLLFVFAGFITYSVGVFLYGVSWTTLVAPIVFVAFGIVLIIWWAIHG
jgi:CHASE2 domain-containing sensor protein